MFKKLLILVIAILLLAICLAVLRWLANRKFEVVPETSATVDMPVAASTTELQTTQASILRPAVQKLLAMDGNQLPTVFFPLGQAQLALLSRIQLADAAVQNIDAQYYLFHDDDAGRSLLGSYVAAADRGVKVRLLLDDMDTAGREPNLIRLVAEHPNLSIRVFNPIYTRRVRPIDFIARFPRSSRRMHNKSMTADNIAAIVGGRNVGNEYFGVRTEHPFVDYDVLLGGQLAGQVSEEFGQYWHSGIAFDIEKLATRASDNSSYGNWFNMLEEAYQEAQTALGKLHDLPIEQMLHSNVVPFYANGEVINDKPQKVLAPLFDASGWLAPTIFELITAAKKDVLIVSPYFIPGDELVEKFTAMVKSGVDVTIITNSYLANDVVAVHSAYMNYRHDLLRAGVKLYELKSETPAEEHKTALLGSKKSSLHAKFFVVDRQLTFVGSFNLDPRSAIHNTEMGVVLRNQPYADKTATDVLSSVASHTYHLELDSSGNINWHDNSASSTVIHDKEPDIGPMAGLALKIMAWLPVELLL